MQLMPQKTQTTFTRIVIFLDVFLLIKWYYYRSPAFFQSLPRFVFWLFSAVDLLIKAAFPVQGAMVFFTCQVKMDWPPKVVLYVPSLQLTTIAPVVKDHSRWAFDVSCRERKKYIIFMFFVFLCER